MPDTGAAAMSFPRAIDHLFVIGRGISGDGDIETDRHDLSNGQSVTRQTKRGWPDAYFLTGRGGTSVAITAIQAEELVPGISKGMEGGKSACDDL